MSRLSLWLGLVSLLILGVSCAEKKSPPEQIGTPVLVKTPSSEKLRFTSGIRAILQDRQGNYWLGSHQEGACRFDGTSYHYFTTEEGLANNQVRSIREGKNGHIWFGTAEGASCYDGEKIIHPKQSVVPGKWSSSGEDLWFNAGNQPGVYRYDGLNLAYLAFPSPGLSNADNAYLTTCIAKGAKGMLWIGTYAGVFGYNGQEFTFINDETLELDGEKGYLHIRSILEDSKGRLWIGNNGIGVLLFDRETTVNFSEQHNLIHAESARSGRRSPAGTLEHVFAIEEDSQGNIWFGDRDTGVWKFDGESFANYTVDAGLESPMVWDIYEDQNQDLLVAMAEGGVYRFEGGAFVKRF